MKKLVLIFVFLFFSQVLIAGVHPKLINVVNELKTQGFSEKEIERIFSDSRLKVYSDIPVLRKKKINYFDAALGLFNPESILRGKEFLRDYFHILSKAEEKFGIPKEIIVAILRIETNFGKYLGKRELINTFYSRILLDVKREEAEKELVSFLILCRKMNLDPFSIKGSYMGCFGLPQFYPSNFLQYALDGNGDEKIDLFLPEDAIFSVGNFLKKKGWKQDFYSQRDALKKYNSSDEYVLAVLVFSFLLTKI